jgi:isopentenyl-diphosphate Delta-isomerase
MDLSVPRLRTWTRVAFSCYVFTSDGRLLLTMRGQTRRSWPGLWTNSCHGHPGQGESLDDAVERTLHTELGLSEPTAELVLPTFCHRASTGDELCPVYRVVTDACPHPDPSVVGDFEWVAWPDFVYAVATGDITVTPWCRQQVTELRALDEDPTRWPVADTTTVPAA